MSLPLIDPSTATGPVADIRPGIGASDEEVAAAIVHVALYVLTNYVNNGPDVSIDLPVAAA